MLPIKNRGKIILALLVAVLILGIINSKHKTVSEGHTAQHELIKKGILHKDAIESSIFVFGDKLYYLVSDKADQEKNRPEKITIYSFPNRKRIRSLDTAGMRLASVLVEKNKLHIFLTKDWTNYGRSTIYLISSTDLKNFTSPVPIVRARKGEGLFNTSVTKNTKTGEYIMALEFDARGYTTFSIRFLKSKDLLKWTEYENFVFGAKIYAACPKIKYIEGNYYLWYAVKNGDKNEMFSVMIAKSNDLRIWTSSKKIFLSPSRSEGVNNSDVDLEEYDNKTYVLYADGNQTDWGNIRYAVYNGSVEDMVKNYFD